MSKTLPSSLSISSRVLLRKRKPFTGWNACSMKLWSQTRCSIWNGTPQCLTRSCYQYFNLSLRSLKNVRRRYRLWIRLILFITLFPGSSKTMTRTSWKKAIYTIFLFISSGISLWGDPVWSTLTIYHTTAMNLGNRFMTLTKFMKKNLANYWSLLHRAIALPGYSYHPCKKSFLILR